MKNLIIDSLGKEGGIIALKNEKKIKSKEVREDNYTFLNKQKKKNFFSYKWFTHIK